MIRIGYAVTAAAVALATAASAFFHPAPRLLWNASASVPIGFYAVRPGDRPVFGDLVAVLPPPPLAHFLAVRRYLPVGMLLLKHIAALPGQTVCRQGVVVTIDGRAVAAALPRDRRGRPLPIWQGCRTVSPTEIFLLNPAVRDSFDGRYFGPLPASTIVGRAASLRTDERQ